MPDRKQQLINVFQDTQEFYTVNKTLAAAVAYGRQNAKLYEPDDYPEIPVSNAKTKNYGSKFISTHTLQHLRVE